MAEAPGDRPLAIGCMRLSTEADRDEARAVATLHAALDAGVTLLDTADAYGWDDSEAGHNERLVARALASWRGDPSRVRVATKGGLTRPGGRWAPDGRARHLIAACRASLRALGVERIHLYQLHAPDPRTPLATSVRALASLRRDGLVEHLGLCNVSLDGVGRARSRALRVAPDEPGGRAGERGAADAGAARAPARARRSASGRPRWYDGVVRRSRSGARTPAAPDDVELLPGRREAIRRHRDDGWLILGVSWQPEIAGGARSAEEVGAIFARTHELLGAEIDCVYCPHADGPAACWCRKPLPGLGVLLVERHRLDPTRCVYVGQDASDEAFARTMGFTYRDGEDALGGA